MKSIARAPIQDRQPHPDGSAGRIRLKPVRLQNGKSSRRHSAGDGQSLFSGRRVSVS